jgi:integrase
VKLFKEFARVTGATLLNDLTQANIKEYRDFVEKTVDAPSTRKWQYGQVKSVLAFGLKDGIDAAQIRVALDKCKVLWVGEKMPAAKPCPMSPADFRALLAGTDDKWRAILLLGLNLCLHLGEVTALKWESFLGDYYSTAREKTGVARGAVLWQETKDAMAKLPRKGPYVLTSCHGTRFNRNGITNEFLKLRRQLGVAKDLTFEGVRDGAYTAALQSCEEKIVRVLAGHKSAGQLDSYVLRDPACTRPAVAAVHKVYGPFPS